MRHAAGDRSVGPHPLAPPAAGPWSGRSPCPVGLMVVSSRPSSPLNLTTTMLRLWLTRQPRRSRRLLGRLSNRDFTRVSASSGPGSMDARYRRGPPRWPRQGHTCARSHPWHLTSSAPEPTCRYRPSRATSSSGWRLQRGPPRSRRPGSGARPPLSYEAAQGALLAEGALGARRAATGRVGAADRPPCDGQAATSGGLTSSRHDPHGLACRRRHARGARWSHRR